MTKPHTRKTGNCAQESVGVTDSPELRAPVWAFGQASECELGGWGSTSAKGVSTALVSAEEDDKLPFQLGPGLTGPLERGPPSVPFREGAEPLQEMSGPGLLVGPSHFQDAQFRR